VNKIADVLAAFALVAGVLVATRPGSKGPALLTAAGNAVAHVEQGATGQKLS
jgi:hypothetical protein